MPGLKLHCCGLVFVAAAVMAFPHRVDAAAAFSNGSFEVGTNSSSVYGLAEPWTLTNANAVNATAINAVPDTITAASDGVRFVSLNAGSVAGSVSQTFLTVPGTVYDVTFEQNQLYNGTNDPQYAPQPTTGNIAVTVGDFAGNFIYKRGSLAHFIVTDQAWTPRSFEFTALDTSSTLLFASTTPSGAEFGQAIDAVNVVVAPEPATLGLLGIGLVSVTLRRRR